MPPEYAEKVGLFVHEKPESFYYPGTTTLDTSNMMAVHQMQVLPFNCQNVLQQIFREVELNEEDSQEIKFKSQDLAGYFEIKVLKLRYDWPDPGATKFRADVELMADFRKPNGRLVWRETFNGEGIGFTDTNIRLTRFGREATTALEDAFQEVVYAMQDGVKKSQEILMYLREFQAEKELESGSLTPSAPAA